MTDTRPANCRFRLRDEGKGYPRSSCAACGKSVRTGLGNKCTAAGVLPDITERAAHIADSIEAEGYLSAARLMRELIAEVETLRDKLTNSGGVDDMARFKAAAARITKEATQSPEAARAYLTALGILDEEGKLSVNYGGQGA